MEVTKGNDGRYYKPCSSCGEMQSYLRKNYAVESLRLKKMCKKCSNQQVDNCHRGWHRGVRVSWFNKFKIGAETRGIEWDLSIDDIADVYDQQGRECALTGWPLVFPSVGHPQNTDASIDRIDSKLGYKKNNIQIVSKKVNMMKQHYSLKDFLFVCKAVADKVKW